MSVRLGAEYAHKGVDLKAHEGRRYEQIPGIEGTKEAIDQGIGALSKAPHQEIRQIDLLPNRHSHDGYVSGQEQMQVVSRLRQGRVALVRAKSETNGMACLYVDPGHAYVSAFTRS
jgi:hypothetical protein